jgi:hypothetical protein
LGSWLQREYLVNEVQHMFAALGRGYIGFHFIAEKDGAYLVVVCHGRKRKHSGHFGHLVVAALAAATRLHAVADIQQQHHRQRAFFFKNFAEGMPKTGTGIPVDKANIVARVVFSYFLKTHSPAFEGRMILARKNMRSQPLRFYFDELHLFKYRFEVGQFVLFVGGYLFLPGAG